MCVSCVESDESGEGEQRSFIQQCIRGWTVVRAEVKLIYWILAHTHARAHTHIHTQALASRQWREICANVAKDYRSDIKSLLL